MLQDFILFKYLLVNDSDAIFGTLKNIVNWSLQLGYYDFAEQEVLKLQKED